MYTLLALKNDPAQGIKQGRYYFSWGQLPTEGEPYMLETDTEDAVIDDKEKYVVVPFTAHRLRSETRETYKRRQSIEKRSAKRKAKGSVIEEGTRENRAHRRRTSPRRVLPSPTYLFRLLWGIPLGSLLEINGQKFDVINMAREKGRVWKGVREC